jgi:hypothetical protein
MKDPVIIIYSCDERPRYSSFVVIALCSNLCEAFMLIDKHLMNNRLACPNTTVYPGLSSEDKQNLEEISQTQGRSLNFIVNKVSINTLLV